MRKQVIERWLDRHEVQRSDGVRKTTGEILTRQRRWRMRGLAFGLCVGFFLPGWTAWVLTMLLFYATGGLLAELTRAQTSSDDEQSSTVLVRRSIDDYTPRWALNFGYLAVLILCLLPVALWWMLEKMLVDEHIRYSWHSLRYLGFACAVMLGLRVALESITRRPQRNPDTVVIELDDAVRSDAAVHVMRCTLSGLYVMVAAQSIDLQQIVRGHHDLYNISNFLGCVIALAILAAIALWSRLDGFVWTVHRLRQHPATEIRS